MKHSVTARQLLQSDQEQAELMEQQEVPTMAQVPESELLEQFEERLLVVVVKQKAEEHFTSSIARELLE